MVEMSSAYLVSLVFVVIYSMFDAKRVLHICAPHASVIVFQRFISVELECKGPCVEWAWSAQSLILRSG